MPPVKNSNMGTCMAPAGTITKGAKGLLEELEQRQALRHRKGLQGGAQGDVLLVERRDRLGVVQALQIADGLLQLRLLTRGHRLLRGDGIQPSADGRPDIGSLIQRLIDVVDRTVDRIVERRR